MSGIPNDLLYAIMNKTDVGAFLSDKMRYLILLSFQIIYTMFQFMCTIIIIIIF